MISNTSPGGNINEKGFYRNRKTTDLGLPKPNTLYS